jgi:hypothetical protein
MVFLITGYIGRLSSGVGRSRHVFVCKALNFEHDWNGMAGLEFGLSIFRGRSDFLSFLFVRCIMCWQEGLVSLLLLAHNFQGNFSLHAQSHPGIGLAVTDIKIPTGVIVHISHAERQSYTSGLACLAKHSWARDLARSGMYVVGQTVLACSQAFFALSSLPTDRLMCMRRYDTMLPRIKKGHSPFVLLSTDHTSLLLD